MKKRKLYSEIMLVLFVLMALSGCKKGEEQKAPAGLNKIIPWNMGFLAVGDQGMLLEISPEGESRNISLNEDLDFLSAWSDGNSVFVSGENGRIYRGDAALSFVMEETGCEENLTAGTSFLDREYCGGENGIILSSPDSGIWERCSVRLSGNVTGMASSDDRCLVVTDAGEAAVTENGSTWSVLEYSEYYQTEVSFHGLTYNGGNFWAYGDTDEGTGLFYTVSGTVWSERDINYLEGSSADLSEIRILSFVSDGQQVYAWCEGGKLYAFPDCVQCNKETDVEGLTSGAAAYNGGKLLIAEDSAHIVVLDTDTAKQFLISAETAYQKQQEGAVLIDVRSREEHEKEAVKGSVSIPLDELEERLPEEYPDLGQVLIFYCSKGIRSQTAAETARALGYVEIYSMGSIDEWNYEME